MAMVATLVTLSRFPLLMAVIAALYWGSPRLQFVAVGALFLGLVLDTVDGVIARKRNEASLVGSVLDIAADRTYELVLWTCYADLGLIPVVMPLIVVTRTALTDAFRSVGVGQGTAPFAQLRTWVGRFLVASSVMRTAYGVSKVMAFCGLALAQVFRSLPGPAITHQAWKVGQVMAWVCMALCVVRGLPVIVQGLQQYWVTSRPRTA
jgi:CDP-diacylglycerol--glycerol-3-phosphate 3-phosphatidyltransferase